MKFKLTYWTGETKTFSLDNLPPTLSRRDSSTMDMSWFVDGYMKKMKVGEIIPMEFDNQLERIE